MTKIIIIKNITLINFKGVRELSIDFNERVTNIFGRNGAGKTTIFDAFTWLLFGKDSMDRKKFDLKTLDADGKIIPQLPHEVSAVINVNGTDIKLVRRFNENWVRRKGVAERVFTGNAEERFFNDVPCNKQEYEAKIAQLCGESIFKFITSPTYFPTQNEETQKAMLLRMAGEISDREVAAGNEDFVKLLDSITGKTLAEYKKEIAKKKANINDEMSDIPGRIDEKKRELTGAENWAVLESELSEKTAERDKIQAQIESEYEAIKAASAKRTELFRKLSAKRDEKARRTDEIKSEVTREYHQKKRERDNLNYEIQSLNSQIANLNNSIKNDETEVNICTNRRNALIAEFNQLHAKSQGIRLEKLSIDESEFVCPTCKRPLEISDIEARQAELEKHFEDNRSHRLQEVNDAIQENQRRGKANNAKKESYLAHIEQCRTKINELQARINEINGMEIMTANLVEPDATPLLNADLALNTLNDGIVKLESETAKEPEINSNDELKSQRDRLNSEISSLNIRLAKKETIRKAEARIAELEKKTSRLNEELTQLERIEFVMLEFSKAKSAAIEKRINGLFSFVRFRWIATAVNGAESETCEATLNGKPYSTCSNAERTLIGLDIINAICKSQGVYAPIFVDNAESINDIIPMQSQIISLIVSQDESLVIENGAAQRPLFN